MEYLISMFIDNELNLDDKTEFVEKVYRNASFREQTIDLLNQEKLIRSDIVPRVPSVKLGMKSHFVRLLGWRPVVSFSSALAVVLAFWLFFPSSDVSRQTPFRFIIFQPEADQVEIAGSFTKWQKTSMLRKGDTGYWEITLDLRKENTDSYIFLITGKRSLILQCRVVNRTISVERIQLY